MGMMETKIIQVKNDPQVINEVNEAWGRWGWSVLNIQVTHSQNTREYQDWSQYGSNQVTVETTTINYATITYQRDKSMPGYHRICELEQEYNTAEHRVQASLSERRNDLENAKQALPHIHTMGVYGVIIMVVSAITLLSLAKQMLFNGVRISSMNDVFILLGLIATFSVNLYRFIKYIDPQNLKLISVNKKTSAEIDSKLSLLDNEAYNMVREEKSRILSEAAQLLLAA